MTTVDVVVLDEDGRPVRGLTAGDFTLREDGAPQEIVAFEVRDLPASRPQQAMLPPVDVVDEEHTTGEIPGRALGFVVDDMHPDARCTWAKDAIRHWIRNAADPRDRLTLATSSGRVVSGTIAGSRGTMLRTLEAIRCGSAINAAGEMSDFQAYQTTRSGRPTPMARYDAVPSSVVVAPDMLAQMVVSAWRRRAARIVGAIEAFCAEHAQERGRKSVLVFTAGFIRDDDLKQAEQAKDAAQRTNTAVYFVDPRGLSTVSFSEASQGNDLAGGEQIAVETGGALVTSNDVDGALQRVVDESSAYYLLGYVPPRPPDGKWRKLRVDVMRKGVKVRARRGYYASRTPLAASDQPPPPADMAPEGVVAREPPPQQETTPPVASPDRLLPAEPGPPASAPDGPPTLQFAARAEAVTVDVVILDEEGRPVSGLSKDEFTLLEDGRQQPVVGFEARVLAAETAAEDAQPSETPIASNEEAAASRGRTLAFVIDDLGIQPAKMLDATRALSEWLAAGADPRDEVTLATSSGQAWWSDTVGEGREDLEAVLARIKGRKLGTGSRNAISDFEAYSIDVQGSPSESPTQQQMQTGAPPAGNDKCLNTSTARTMLDRVVNRWFVDHTCICDPMNPGASIRECRSLALLQARDVHDAARRRTVALLASVERISRGLSPSRGRKAVVVLSEGFLQDVDQQAFQRAVDASRRGNTSVSFVDVRGLYGLPVYGADQSAAPLPGDAGMTSAIARADTAGAETLADRTGGSVTQNTNDLAGAVRRLADESSAYYLLGYQTDRPFDGRWRKLQVKVSRPGVSVRARRGYYATAEPAPLVAPKPAKADKKRAKGEKKQESLPVRALDPTLSVGGRRDEIPIRMAPHVFETDAAGQVRVLVALEVNTAALSFAATGSGAERKAKLDVTVLGVSRDHATMVPLDSAVELSLEQTTPGGWWIFSRELKLPPGPAQVRTLVRDTATGRSGLVAQRLDVPNPAAPYLSTPILTNLTSKSTSPGARIVPVAHRRFAPRGNLFCAYEVYIEPGRELTSVPDVRSSYTLSDDSGRVVSSEPPTAISVALGGSVARTHALPLAQLPPGRYRLALQATDARRRLDLRWGGDFVVEVAAGPTPARTDDLPAPAGDPVETP